jgi:hypothetical protein
MIQIIDFIIEMKRKSPADLGEKINKAPKKDTNAQRKKQLTFINKKIKL